MRIGYIACSGEVVPPVTAYGGPSAVKTDVCAFQTLRHYLTHIVGTEISSGNCLIIPLANGERKTNKKERFQVLMVARELLGGSRISV